MQLSSNQTQPFDFAQPAHPPRLDFFSFANGERAKLPFSQGEFDNRLAKLRKLMQAEELDAVLLSSMHNVAYYTGFLYCAFGRPYGCVVTADACTTLSANIDFSQPWRRSHCDNIIYTDWQKDNYWRAASKLIKTDCILGIEADHLTLASSKQIEHYLQPARIQDVCAGIMQQRMIKSEEEIKLISSGAGIADMGGEAIRNAIRQGTREIDVAMAGRNAMELAISEQHPDSELRDSWVWFQSGINTDGAHNPVTTRKLVGGDILSLNAFPMISGYYTALERTLFVDDIDKDSLKIWEANVAAHELGISLIKPGIRCHEVCNEINEFFLDRNLLDYRTFGYGHSFGVLSHYYGREAGLEIREDVDTALVPGMVVSIEPMLTIPDGMPGAGGYREHDILVVTEDGCENITGFPYGPEHNIISN